VRRALWSCLHNARVVSTFSRFLLHIQISVSASISPPLSRSVSSSVHCLAFPAAMGSTCPYSLHMLKLKLASENLLHRQERAGCSKGIANDSAALIDAYRSISGSTTHAFKHGQVRTGDLHAGSTPVVTLTAWTVRRVTLNRAGPFILMPTNHRRASCHAADSIPPT